MRMFWRLFGVLVPVLAAQQAFAANDWVNMLSLDPTGGLVAGRLCYSTNGTDISCDAGAPLRVSSDTLYVPTLSTGSIGAGNIDASGVISATGTAGTVTATYIYGRYVSASQVYGTFVGDGSGLTGVVAGSSDRIVSGTFSSTSMVAISNTGIISVTQNGTNTAYFHPQLGLVAIGVSSTGGISGTTGYFTGKVGIGTTSPSAALEVAGTVSATGLTVSGTVDGSVAILAKWQTRALIIKSQTTFYPLEMQYLGAPSEGKYFRWAFNGYGLTLEHPNDAYSSNKPVLTVSGTNSFVGINTLVPTANLEVSGTVSATRFVGDGSGLTNLTVQGDRITSGTLSVTANSATSTVSLTTAGTTWGYLASARSYIPTISTTNTGVSNVLGFDGQAVTAVAGSGGNYIVSGTTSVSVTNSAAKGSAIQFATAGNLAMTISGSSVGIGTATPAGSFEVAGSGISYFTRAGASPAGLALRYSKGTVAAPTTVANGDVVGKLLFYAHDGSSFLNTAGILAIANGTVATGSIPTDLILSTGASDSGGFGGTERMRVTAGGNVGIGTTSPGQKLEVNGGAFLVNNGSGNAYIYLGSNTATSAGRLNWDNNNAKLNLGSNGTDRMTIDASGNVGIGTTNPGSLLDVNGKVSAGQYYANVSSGGGVYPIDVRVDGNPYFQVRQNGNTYTLGGSVQNISSRRFKKNIVDTRYTLDDLMKIKIREFQYTDKLHKNITQIGVIAEEVAPTIPLVIDYDEQNKPYAVNYSALALLSIKAIQELKAQNDALRADFEAYKKAHP